MAPATFVLPALLFTPVARALVQRNAVETEPRTTVRHISKPVAQHFSEMARKARRLNIEEMVGVKVRSVAHPRSPLLIMDYPEEEEYLVPKAVGAGKGWENTHAYTLCQLWRKDGMIGNILDVGANVGAYTLPLAECLQGHGTVIAVEGIPETADHLRAGIIANNATNVELYPYVVGKAKEDTTLTMFMKRSWTPVTAMLTSGDAMLHSNPKLQALMLAKLELEGNEGHFLEGAQELFVNYPPCYLVIELIPDLLKNAGTPLRQILKQLKRWGYRAADHGPMSMPSQDEAISTPLKTWTIKYGKTEADHQTCVKRVAELSKQQL